MASRLGKMVQSGALTPTHVWQKKCVDAPERALAKLRDPVCLARYWTGICFLNHESLGSPAVEAALAGSMAIMEVIRDLYREK